MKPYGCYAFAAVTVRHTHRMLSNGAGVLGSDVELRGGVDIGTGIYVAKSAQFLMVCGGDGTVVAK